MKTWPEEIILHLGGDHCDPISELNQQSRDILAVKN
jgi:hypothetical protein